MTEHCGTASGFIVDFNTSKCWCSVDSRTVLQPSCLEACSNETVCSGLITILISRERDDRCSMWNGVNPTGETAAMQYDTALARR